jgi:hypothetical protein
LPPIRKSRNVISGAEEPRVTKSGARDVKKTEEYINTQASAGPSPSRWKLASIKSSFWQWPTRGKSSPLNVTLAAVHAERAAQPWMTTVVKN